MREKLHSGIFSFQGENKLDRENGTTVVVLNNNIQSQNDILEITRNVIFVQCSAQSPR